MNKIPLIFLIMLLLQGCMYNPPVSDPVFLNEEDLEWLIADTCAVFHSNKGRIDTITSPAFVLCDDKVQAYRSFTCSNKQIKFFISECIQRMDSDQLGISITFRRWLGKPADPDIQVYNRIIEPIKYTMDGETYDECIVINNWDTDSLYYYSREKGLNVSNAIFAKNVGLICYKLEDGEEFIRKFD